MRLKNLKLENLLATYIIIWIHMHELNTLMLCHNIATGIIAYIIIKQIRLAIKHNS